MKFPLIVLIIFLVGCAPQPIATPDLAVYKITRVVDKITGQPIEVNYLTITIQSEDASLETITDENISENRIEVPVGTVVSIVVQAPGYEDWELAVRFKDAKYIEGPVEMNMYPAEQG